MILRWNHKIFYVQTRHCIILWNNLLQSTTTSFFFTFVDYMYDLHLIRTYIHMYIRTCTHTYMFLILFSFFSSYKFSFSFYIVFARKNMANLLLMVLILQIVNQNTKMASESTMDRKINTKFTCCMAERDEYDDPNNWTTWSQWWQLQWLQTMGKNT